MFSTMVPLARVFVEPDRLVTNCPQNSDREPTKKQISKQTHRLTDKPKHIQTDIETKGHTGL